MIDRVHQATTPLAAGEIEVGEHPEASLFGLALNIDTIIGTIIAALVVLALGFFVRARIVANSKGGVHVPGGTQLFFESMAKHAREQVQQFVGLRVGPFVIPIAMAVFIFLLAANWVGVLPIHEYVPPPTADVNLVYALAVMLFVWWHAAGVRRHRGVGRHALHVVKGHYAPFAPLWIIEEVVHLLSLPLRLFGNMLAGGIMISLLGLLPGYFNWVPIGAWKLFEMAIGLLQAYLFALLTISYFGEAMASGEEH